jgi:hypothetical protein
MQARNEPEEELDEVRGKSMQAMKQEKRRISGGIRGTDVRAGGTTVRATRKEPIKPPIFKPKAESVNSNEKRSCTEEVANKTKVEHRSRESEARIWLTAISKIKFLDSRGMPRARR